MGIQLTDRGRYVLDQIATRGRARSFGPQSRYRNVAQALADLRLVRRAGRDGFEITDAGRAALASLTAEPNR